MDEQKAKELHQLLFSLLGIFHKKILVTLRKDIQLEPKLKKNQAKVLHLLYLQTNLTPTEVGKMLDLEKGGLTTIIDQLVTLGLLIRSDHPSDGRKTLLSLSAAGKEYTQGMMQAFSQRIVDLFADVDGEELDQYLVNLKYVTSFMQRL